MLTLGINPLIFIDYLESMIRLLEAVLRLWFGSSTNVKSAGFVFGGILSFDIFLTCVPAYTSIFNSELWPYVMVAASPSFW